MEEKEKEIRREERQMRKKIQTGLAWEALARGKI